MEGIIEILGFVLRLIFEIIFQFAFESGFLIYNYLSSKERKGEKEKMPFLKKLFISIIGAIIIIITIVFFLFLLMKIC